MAAVAGALFCAPAALAAPPTPAGLWLTEGGGSIIRIAPCKSDFCGTLVWLKEPRDPDGSPKLDSHNTDESKRGRPMVGIEIFVNLTADGGLWRGKAYNPQDGKLYDVTFKLADDSPMPAQAQLQGCVLRILCQTQVLTRATAVPPPGATP
jgi:uncharacterized protein (DUF2147 family)